MKSFYLFAFAVLVTAPAYGQEMYLMKGQCKTLVIAGEDMTAGCQPYMVSTTSGKDRVGFMFAVGSNRSIDFSGQDIANPTPDTDATAVDLFLSNIAGKNQDHTPVHGTCTFGNPFKGKMTVKCTAADNDGKPYAAMFVTDGGTPQKAPL